MIITGIIPICIHTAQHHIECKIFELLQEVGNPLVYSSPGGETLVSSRYTQGRVMESGPELRVNYLID